MLEHSIKEKEKIPILSLSDDQRRASQRSS